MHSNLAELERAAKNKSPDATGLRWGVVVALHVGAERKKPMVAVPEVHAIAGGGLEGDRYYREPGLLLKNHGANQITLIETEALEAAWRDYEIEVKAHESRRNVLTCGIALNHLVGREFRIGNVLLRGLELCEPCKHLENLTNKQMIKALRHRGGLRAEILSGGAIRVGDTITEAN